MNTERKRRDKTGGVQTRADPIGVWAHPTVRVAPFCLLRQLFLTGGAPHSEQLPRGSIQLDVIPISLRLSEDY